MRTLAAILLAATLPAGYASGEGGPSLRWDAAGRFVEAVDLDSRALTVAQSALNVRMIDESGKPASSPMAGRVERLGGRLRWTPRFPVSAGVRYLARLEIADPPISLSSEFTAPPESAGPRSRVVSVYPTADEVPENLLKFYVEFSAPMARGDAYRHVVLRNAATGRPVERPFLEIGEELWDREGKRLTLLLDPGRIKRGLVPREEEGPILAAGTPYVLEIDSAWPDAEGRPLLEGRLKRFRAGAEATSFPGPETWSTQSSPKPGSRDPLTIRFPTPFDHALLMRSITPRVGDTNIQGRVETLDAERLWKFLPDAPWPAGEISLRLDTELEDLAGNSPARPFEVDEVAPKPSKYATRFATISLPKPSQKP